MNKKDYSKLSKKSLFFDDESREQFNRDVLGEIKEIHQEINEEELSLKKKKIEDSLNDLNDYFKSHTSLKLIINTN